MNKIMLPAVLAAILGGCANHAAIDVAANQKDAERCLAMGFQAGSTEFSTCRLISFQKRQDRQATYASAFELGYAINPPFKALTDIGAGY